MFSCSRPNLPLFTIYFLAAMLFHLNKSVQIDLPVVEAALALLTFLGLLADEWGLSPWLLKIEVAYYIVVDC